MRVPFLLRVLGPAVLAVVALAACGDDDRGWHSVPSGGVSTTPTAPPQSDAGPSTVQPILVVVDANKTLTATPGSGVGIFVEYQTGGHWHVWWSCDTNKTGLNCAFDIKGQIDSGSISGGQTEDGTAWGKGQPSSSAYAYTLTPQSFEAQKVTTTEVDGVRFDAPLGAVLTVTSSLGGLADGSFFFFVQNGQVNGGYTGKLTDPLSFQANAP